MGLSKTLADHLEKYTSGEYKCLISPMYTFEVGHSNISSSIVALVANGLRI